MIITEKAYAKLNISLDVLSKMDDGYHEMLMILQTADLYDELSFNISAGNGIILHSNISYLPNDNRNIIWKATELFMHEAGISNACISISVHKRIPICAGMGGGSADAAAVLRALNRVFSVGFSLQELNSIAEKLGSDVPFCLTGGTMLAKGRGTILSDLSPLPDCIFLICKPPFSISTPYLFSQLDCKKIALRPDTFGIISALDNGSLSGVCRRMYNVFEPFLDQGKDKISFIKDTFLQNDALGAVMTGTGSAVFGVFADLEAAKNAELCLPSEYGRCFITHPKTKIEL